MEYKRVWTTGRVIHEGECRDTGGEGMPYRRSCFIGQDQASVFAPFLFALEAGSGHSCGYKEGVGALEKGGGALETEVLLRQGHTCGDKEGLCLRWRRAGLR